MNENKDAFTKGLAELRELASKGSDADSKKLSALAENLLWDVKNSFILPIAAPMLSEHREFIKVLATSETGYWKGYGIALTDFLLPLLNSLGQTTLLQQNTDQETIKPIVEEKPIAQAKIVSEAEDESDNLKFIMD